MIPFLVVLAVAYWLAAPDPVTAGARTASGTAARAAGTGARAHWASGRDGRKLTRTARRDRWSKGGGFWRNLLRLEHGAVVTAKGVKGAAGITRAAVRPIPAAVKAGWVQGRDRHRVKAGNRPVPVALDPPWWRREQPQVQAGEQAPEQVQVQPGNSPQVQPAEQVQTGGGQAEGTDGAPLLPPELRCQRCDVGRYRYTYDGLRVCGPCSAELDRMDDQGGRPGDLDQWPFKTGPDPADTTTDPPAGTCRGTVRGLDLDNPRWMTSPGGRRDVIYGRTDQPCPNAPTGPDGMCDKHRAKTDPPTGTSPDGTTPPTEGDPVPFTGIDTDLNDLTTVQDFALKVADMAEESDFAQLVEFCKNASDEVRDFGADMAGDVAEFEEVAAKIGDLLSELVDAATKVKDRGAELVGG